MKYFGESFCLVGGWLLRLLQWKYHYKLVKFIHLSREQMIIDYYYKWFCVSHSSFSCISPRVHTASDLVSLTRKATFL